MRFYAFESAALGESLLAFLLPQKGAKAVMKYDFGDGWEIKILRLADKTSKEQPTSEKGVKKFVRNEGFIFLTL